MELLERADTSTLAWPGTGKTRQDSCYLVPLPPGGAAGLWVSLCAQGSGRQEAPEQALHFLLPLHPARPEESG